MADRVLVVDDEPHLLAGIQRGLRNRFEIHTATSGAEGLKLLQNAGPFPVVVSDMRMPEMTGVQFLSKVRELYPNSVRIIFTGEADLAATIAAVNEGNIFRFLSKPCTTDYLCAAVESGVRQYQLLGAEKVLLEQTLSGAVSMLVEILSMVMPAAHSRALRLRRYVLALGAALELEEHWQWPLAAMVSQIGCVSLPRDTLSKVEAGQALIDDEQRLYESHPELAGKLLEAIPRLEDVAAIVSAQNGSLEAANVPLDRRQWDVRTAGRVLLRAANEFDRWIAKGQSSAAAAEAVRLADTGLPKFVIEALRTLPVAGKERVMRKVRVLDLGPGMILDEAIVTRKGACLVPAGYEVTETLILRLRSIAAGVQLVEPFRVQVLV